MKQEWYGWQTLLSDGVAVGVGLGLGLGVGLGGKDTKLAWTGLATYLLGGPVVHLANGQHRAAGLSIAMRAGLPLAGGLMLGGGTYLILSPCFKNCSMGQALVVVLMGMLGVSAGGISAIAGDAYLATRSVPANPSSFRVIPTFAITRSQGTLGLAGSF
jgi:hypothetical protein